MKLHFVESMDEVLQDRAGAGIGGAADAGRAGVEVLPAGRDRGALDGDA